MATSTNNSVSYFSRSRLNNTKSCYQLQDMSLNNPSRTQNSFSNPQHVPKVRYKNHYVRHLFRNNTENMIQKYLLNDIFAFFRLKVWLSISSGMITRREKFVTDHVAAKKFCCYEIWSLKSCKMWKQRTHQIILWALL